MCRKFRTRLRADQERDALAVAVVPEQLALDAWADELPLAVTGAHGAAAGRPRRLRARSDLCLDAVEDVGRRLDLGGIEQQRCELLVDARDLGRERGIGRGVAFHRGAL